jgi:hypothetical protein
MLCLSPDFRQDVSNRRERYNGCVYVFKKEMPSEEHLFAAYAEGGRKFSSRLRLVGIVVGAFVCCMGLVFLAFKFADDPYSEAVRRLEPGMTGLDVAAKFGTGYEPKQVITGIIIDGTGMTYTLGKPFRGEIPAKYVDDLQCSALWVDHGLYKVLLYEVSGTDLPLIVRYECGGGRMITSIDEYCALIPEKDSLHAHRDFTMRCHKVGWWTGLVGLPASW